MYSTKTAADAQSYVLRQRGLPSIDDQLVRDAINEFYVMYYEAEEQANRQRLRVTADVDTTNGYAISNFSSLGDDYFEVFEIVDSQILPSYRLPQVQQYETSDKKGWYVSNKSLYTTNQVTSKTVRVFYQKGISEITDATALADHTLDIVKNAEFVLYKFLLEKFYDSKIQMGLKAEAKQEFMEDLARLFRKPARGFSTGLLISSYN